MRSTFASRGVSESSRGRGQFRHSDTTSSLPDRNSLSSCPNVGTDPALSQVELIQRRRANAGAPLDVDNRVYRGIHLSINEVAAGLRKTG
jgi:hypothetical protein